MKRKEIPFINSGRSFCARRVKRTLNEELEITVPQAHLLPSEYNEEARGDCLPTKGQEREVFPHKK